VVTVVVVVVEATLLVAKLELRAGTTAVVPLSDRTICLMVVVVVKVLVSVDVVVLTCAVVLVVLMSKVCVVVLVAVSVIVAAVLVLVLVWVLVLVLVLVFVFDVAQSHHFISLPSCWQQPRDLQWAAATACLS